MLSDILFAKDVLFSSASVSLAASLAATLSLVESFALWLAVSLATLLSDALFSCASASDAALLLKEAINDSDADWDSAIAT